MMLKSDLLVLLICISKAEARTEPQQTSTQMFKCSHALTPSRPHALTPSRPHALTPSRPHALTPSRPRAHNHSTNLFKKVLTQGCMCPNQLFVFGSSGDQLGVEVGVSSSILQDNILLCQNKKQKKMKK